MTLTNSPASSPAHPPYPHATATPVCRGVRGAITVDADTRDEILKATRQLLALMIRRNEIESTDVASVIFTVTHDITAEFPALAARQLGWIDVPLLCGYEVSVPGSLPRCIRILVHWNTTKPQSEILHTYMRAATALRPDLTKLPPVDFEELEHWIRHQMGEA
ncbi:MAG: chorismate mutase [Planctomycetaceae bacterium]